MQPGMRIPTAKRDECEYFMDEEARDFDGRRPSLADNLVSIDKTVQGHLVDWSISKSSLWRKVSVWMKTRWITIVAVIFPLISGCQCCPLFDHYANVVDDVNDTHLYLDRCYNPKFDITRMGKPDWCSPFNSHFCKRCCQNGCYDRYDDCNLYPPLTPYDLPSHVMPPPTVRTTRVPRRLDVQMSREFDNPDAPPKTPDDTDTPVPPVPPVPSPALDQ